MGRITSNGTRPVSLLNFSSVIGAIIASSASVASVGLGQVSGATVDNIGSIAEKAGQEIKTGGTKGASDAAAEGAVQADLVVQVDRPQRAGTGNAPGSKFAKII